MSDKICDHVYGEPDDNGVTYCYTCGARVVIEGYKPLPDGVSMDHEEVKKLVEDQG